MLRIEEIRTSIPSTSVTVERGAPLPKYTILGHTQRAVVNEFMPVPVPEQLQDWVQLGAQDAEASEGLFGYLYPKLTRWFRLRKPEEAEDLAQETVIKVFNSLPSFEDRGQGTFVNTFHRWVYTIARCTLSDGWKKYLKEPHISLDSVYEVQLAAPETLPNLEEQSDPQAKVEALKVRLQDLLQQILIPREWQVVVAKMEGKKCQTTAEELNIDPQIAIQYFVSGRKKVEEHLIYPAGYQRLTELENHQSLKNAARQGRLQAVKFLGRWYIDGDALERYYKNSRMMNRDIKAHPDCDNQEGISTRGGQAVTEAKYNNLQSMVFGAKQGKQEAIIALKEYLHKVFSINFAPRLRGDIQECIHNAVETTIADIEAFQYTRRSGFWKEFKHWVCEKAQNMIKEEQTRRKAERTSQTESTQVVVGTDYLLLSEQVTVAEYYAINRSLEYRGAVVKQNGKNYILKEDIQKFREEKLTQGLPDKTTPPQSGYIPLSEAAPTYAAYIRLQRAAKKGTLPSEKKGTQVFVSQDAISSYLTGQS